MLGLEIDMRFVAFISVRYETDIIKLGLIFKHTRNITLMLESFLINFISSVILVLRNLTREK